MRSKAAARAAAFTSPSLWRVMLDVFLLLAGLRKYRSTFHAWLGLLLKRLESSGAKWTAQYMKECTIMILAVINGVPYEHRPGVPYVAKARSGLPKMLPVSLRKAIMAVASNSSSRGGIHVLRVVLSVLALGRSLKVGARADLSSITDPYTGTATFFTMWRTLRVPLSWVPDSFHMKRAWPHNSLSAGPNGPKAVWSSQFDALALAMQPGQLITLTGFCLVTGQWYIALWLLGILTIILPFTALIYVVFFGTPRLNWEGFASLPTGTLTALHEGGGKVRVVAAADYWTQWALHGLHNAIFALLRSIPQDGTFDQWKPVENHVLPYLGVSKVYSYDLSSATDRLPLFVQVIVLRNFLGTIPSSLWAALMRRPWLYKGKTGSAWLRYTVGQPMGAYSSWAMLALTHHVLVQAAAHRAGHVTWFQRYAIVGDDIVIADSAVAEEYYRLMTVELGVKISVHKSIVSETGLMEFTKRFYHARHGDLSPLPIRLVATAVRKPRFLPQLFVHARERGWFASVDQVLVTYTDCASFLKVYQGLITAGVVLLLRPEVQGKLAASPWVKHPEGLLQYILCYPPVAGTFVVWSKANWQSVKRRNAAACSLVAWSNIKAVYAHTFDLATWRQSVGNCYYGSIRSLCPAFWVTAGREAVRIYRYIKRSVPMLCTWRPWVWPGPLWCLNSLKDLPIDQWTVGDDGNDIPSVWTLDTSEVKDGPMVGAVEDALSRFNQLILEKIEYEDDYGRYFGPTELVISSGTPGAYHYPVTGVRSLDHYLLAHHKAALPLTGPRPRRTLGNHRPRRPLQGFRARRSAVN